MTTAEVTARKGAFQAMQRCKGNLDRVHSVLAGGGYIGEPFTPNVREKLGEAVTVQIAKRRELHKFAVISKRGVVERSFAWLEKNRRLWKNCER
jgi:transposase